MIKFESWAEYKARTTPTDRMHLFGTLACIALISFAAFTVLFLVPEPEKHKKPHHVKPSVYQFKVGEPKEIKRVRT